MPSGSKYFTGWCSAWRSVSSWAGSSAKIITVICAGVRSRRINSFFSAAQIFGAAFMSFMHGAQDGSLSAFSSWAWLSATGRAAWRMMIPVWLMLLCSVVMGVGISVGGEKIIKSVGMDMVKLGSSRDSPRTLPERYACSCQAYSASRCPLLIRRPAPSWAWGP